jgi:hypothetical protein
MITMFVDVQTPLINNTMLIRSTKIAEQEMKGHEFAVIKHKISHLSQ